MTRFTIIYALNTVESSTDEVFPDANLLQLCFFPTVSESSWYEASRASFGCAHSSTFPTFHSGTGEASPPGYRCSDTTPLSVVGHMDFMVGMLPFLNTYFG